MLLIGKSSNSKINRLVVQEAMFFKNIVMRTFADTFRNLYKKMILVEWPLAQNCFPSHIPKTDEDCFIIVRNLFYWLKSYHITNGSKPIYAGRVQMRMPAVRDSTNRYYLSEKEFPEPYFSPYASG